MGTRKRFLGWYQPGIGHPSFPARPSMRATSSATLGDRDRRASTAATGRRIVPSIPESLLGRAWGCFGGPVGVLHGREPRGVVGSPGHARDSQPWWRNHSSRRECRTGFAARRAAAKGKTATLFRQRLGIRLDENLDGLFAGINLDTTRRAAKVDLVASSVRSSNDGV
jgi:hypothetical protein